MQIMARLIPAAACWLAVNFSEQGHVSSTVADSQWTEYVSGESGESLYLLLGNNGEAYGI